MDPGLSSLDESATRPTFRRGKTLILLVVIGTAIFALYDPARSFWLHGWRGFQVDQIYGLVLVGGLCWCILCGGKIAIGCFSALYGLFLVGFAAYVNASFFHPWTANPDFDTSFRGTISWLAIGLWSFFALWVLLFSKDARGYLQARRRGLAEREAHAFEWPPASRRG